MSLSAECPCRARAGMELAPLRKVGEKPRYPLLHVALSFHKGPVRRPPSFVRSLLLGLRLSMFHTQNPIGHSHNYSLIFVL